MKATVPQQRGSLYAWNVTSMELVIQTKMPEISKDMKISVAAVSMCSQMQGQEVIFNKKGGERQPSSAWACCYAYAIYFACLFISSVHDYILILLIIINYSYIHVQK